MIKSMGPVYGFYEHASKATHRNNGLSTFTIHSVLPKATSRAP
jgi:hypothetical protein